MSDRQRLPHGSRLQFLSPRNQKSLRAYLTLLQARQYAPSSIDAMVTSIKSLYQLLPETRRRKIAQDFAALTPEDIDTWIDAASTHGLAPSTIMGRLRLLRRFFEFLMEQGHLLRQPIRRHRHEVTVPQYLPHPIPDDDLVTFFRVIDSLRNRLIFLLMLRCGLRVSETVRLKWDAINWEQGTLRIDDGKGAVDRIVYFSPDVDTAMQQWQRLQSPKSVYFFPSRHQKKAGAPLDRKSINDLMNAYIKQAGLPHYTPHALRHTFATQMLNAGVTLEVLKELMGHQHLDMTLRYAKLYEGTKRDQYDRAMGQVEKRRQSKGGQV